MVNLVYCGEGLTKYEVVEGYEYGDDGVYFKIISECNGLTLLSWSAEHEKN